MLSNFFDGKQLPKGTFGGSWLIQIQMYPQTSIGQNMVNLTEKNLVSAHDLELRVQLS